MELACDEITLERRLAELHERSAHELCESLQGDIVLFNEYWGDVDRVLAPPQDYKKIDEHLSRCYKCDESYREFLDDIPELFRKHVEEMRARARVKELMVRYPIEEKLINELSARFSIDKPKRHSKRKD